MAPCKTCTSTELCKGMGFCVRAIYTLKEELKDPNTDINPFLSDIAEPDTELKEEGTEDMEIVMIEATKDAIFEEVARCFNSDADLAKFHVLDDSDHEEMIKHTIDTIKSIDYDKKYYLVALKSEPDNVQIGYAVTIDEPQKILYSFAIRTEFRTKEILKEWLKVVKEKFENANYKVPLYIKNTRAIGFFLKNDFTIEKNEDDHVILKSNDNSQKPCQ